MSVRFNHDSEYIVLLESYKVCVSIKGSIRWLCLKWHRLVGIYIQVNIPRSEEFTKLDIFLFDNRILRSEFDEWRMVIDPCVHCFCNSFKICVSCIRTNKVSIVCDFIVTSIESIKSKRPVIFSKFRLTHFFEGAIFFSIIVMQHS